MAAHLGVSAFFVCCFWETGNKKGCIPCRQAGMDTTPKVISVDFLVENGLYQQISDGTHAGCTGNCQYPGGQHLLGYAPMDGLEALGCTDTHDGTGYDVGRTDRQVEQGSAEDDDC